MRRANGGAPRAAALRRSQIENWHVPIGRGRPLLCGRSDRVELVDQVVELLHDRHKTGQTLLALRTQLRKSCQRRADVTDRIAGGASQGLGVALVAVGRMALADDLLHMVDQTLDALGVFPPALLAIVAEFP